MENISTRPGSKHVTYDSGEPWLIFFQDNDITQKEALQDLHNNIIFYSGIVIIALTSILIFILLNYTKSLIQKK